MINFDYITEENIKEHNPNWPQLPDHPKRILIIGNSGSGKTNALLNLKRFHLDTDKIYLYAKGPYEAKYQLLINKREGVGWKKFVNFKAFIEYSNNIDNIHENFEEYNPLEQFLCFPDIFKRLRGIQIRNAKYWSYFMIWLLIGLVIKILNK